MDEIKVHKTLAIKKTTNLWLRGVDYWDPDKNSYLKKYKLDVNASLGQADIVAFPMPLFPGKCDYTHRECDVDQSRYLASHHPEDFTDKAMIADGCLSDFIFRGTTTREILKYPQVRAYTPNLSFRNPVAFRRKAWQGSYYGDVFHNKLTYDIGYNPRLDLEELPPNIAAKIKPVLKPSFPAIPDDVLEYIAKNKKPLHKRNIDLSFSGRDSYYPYGQHTMPTAHRQRLTRHLWNDLPGNKYLGSYYFRLGKTCGKSLEYPFEYFQNLLDSKFVVSPWGYSPWCIREFEAMLCGCVVIKPECSNMMTYPDIYDPNHNFMVWTDIMMDNLKDQLNYCYSNLEEMQHKADAGSKFLFHHFYPSAKLFAYWAKNMRLFIEEALTPQYSVDVPDYREPLVLPNFL